MEMRFRDLVNNLDHDELLALRKDLHMGSVAIKKVIEEKIKANEKSRERYCAVCDKKMDAYSANYTLLFGPDDFKKRASFCALDCLEYFTNYLKDLNNNNKKIAEDEGEKLNVK